MLTDDRLVTCFHEAGHAVTMIASGQRFEYITMRPRTLGSAAHVMVSDPLNALYTGQWLAHGAVAAAGILAADFYLMNAENYEPDTVRRTLTRDDGRDDLKELRAASWYAYACCYENPAWSATPVSERWGPVEFAVAAWEHAVSILTGYGDAVVTVADELYDSARKVPYRVVREIVDGSWVEETVVAGVPEEFLEPWFLKYSRLRWVPSEKHLAQLEQRDVQSIAV